MHRLRTHWETSRGVTGDEVVPEGKVMSSISGGGESSLGRIRRMSLRAEKDRAGRV